MNADAAENPLRSQKSHRRIWWILAAPVVLGVLLVLAVYGYGLWAHSRVDVRLLLHADHRLYEGPRREDGSVDYVAAIDRIFSEGVTAENNFAIAFFNTLPADSELSEAAKLVIAQDVPFEQPAPFPISSFQSAKLATPIPANSQIANEQWATQLLESQNSSHSGSEPDWSSLQIQTLESFVDNQNTKLDYLAVEVRKRNRFYYSYGVPPSHFWSLRPQNEVVEHLRRIESWFLLRCRLAILRGELSAAWRDLETLLLMQQRISQSSNWSDFHWSLIGLGSVVDQLQKIVNRDGYDLELLSEIETRLAESEIETWGERQLDVTVRGEMGFHMDCYLQGISPLNGEPEAVGMPGLIRPVPIMDQLNSKLDAVIRSFQQTGEKPMTDEIQRIRDNYMPTVSISRLRPLQYENYQTQADLTMSVFVCAVNHLEQQSCRESQLRRAKILLAVARFRIDHGRFPTGFAEIEDRIPSEDWIDPRTGANLVWIDEENQLTIKPSEADYYPWEVNVIK